VIPRLPYLAPWYRIATAESKVVLEYGQRLVCLEGGAAERLLPALLPLLDGTHALDDIVGVLGEPARAAVVHALEQLSEHGLVLEGPPAPPDLPAPFSDSIELLASLAPRREPLSETADRLAARSVIVVGAGTAGVEVARLLRLSGVSVEQGDSLAGGFDLALCSPAPGELPRLSDWNVQALAGSQPWLQVLPFDGRYSAVGPLYIPEDTCCYECFRLRRAANLDAGDELALVESVPAAYPTAPALHAVVGGLASMLALEWLILEDHYVPAALYAFELQPVLRLTVHHVHRVPRCPVCSGLADVAPPLPWHKEIRLAHG
jgi:bacteriocin biosynthesis cyclodehydratase domain-containing protein